MLQSRNDFDDDGDYDDDVRDSHGADQIVVGNWRRPD